VTRAVLDFGRPAGLILAGVLHLGSPMQSRESDEFARLAFTGLEPVPPGVVLVSEWRPDQSGQRPTPAEVGVYGGVARKP
jgi:S-adenosyl methyltransferase